MSSVTGSMPSASSVRGSSGTAPATSRPEVPGVEPDVVGPGLAHPPQDGLGHDVARREVGQLVLPLHEPGAVVVDEERALAAHGLADQRLLPARVRAEPGRRSGGTGRTRGRAPRPRPAARRRRRRRSRRSGSWSRRYTCPMPPVASTTARARTAPTPSCWPSPMTCRVSPATVRRRRRSRSSTSACSMTSTPGRVEHARDEGPLDLGAGRVAAGVGDAVAVVAALAGQRHAAVGGRGRSGRRSGPARAPPPRPRAPAPAPRPRRTRRRRPRSCRGSARRASRRRPAPRRCRPAPSGSTRRRGRPW